MTKEEHASHILKSLSDELDIPDSHYEKATARYKSFGDHLHRPQSGVLKYKPVYSPQGSFSLGTVTKSPNGQRPCYDLDSVVELTAMSKNSITQAGLKELVGLEAKTYAEQNGVKKPVHEGKRCWTIEYSDSDVDFHIDFLPAVPEELAAKRILTRLWGVPESQASLAVAITDRQHPQYSQITQDWPPSNPRGFAEWFRETMKPAGRKLLVERHITASIDDVPTYQWRTPLQRSVQMLKRHRDIYFADDPDHKPASIIVTTLAAHCYNNQLDLYEAMRKIVNDMPNKIEPRGDEFWIPNPVNPKENFADRWRDDRVKALRCYEWLGAVRDAFEKIISETGLHKVGTVIEASFGEDAAHGTLRRMGDSMKQDRVAGRLRVEATGVLGATGHPVKSHEFYGQTQD